MEKDLKNQIEKLYLVRALLSMISQSTEKFDSPEEKRDSVKEQAFESKYKKQYETDLEIKQKSEQRIEEIKSELSELEKNEPELAKKVELGTSYFSSEGVYKGPLSSYEEYKKSCGWKGSLVFAFVCLAITSIACFFLFKWWVNTDFSFWVGLLAFPAAIASLIWDIACFASSVPPSVADFEKRKEQVSKELEEARIEIDSNALKKEELTKEITTLQNTIAEKIVYNQSVIDAEYNVFLQEKKNLVEKITREQIVLIKEISAVYECAKKISPIRESDWENLDVILYEIESGRASTLKEALQQTDLYKRHEEIIEKLEIATKAICYTITSSVDRLSMSIGTQLKELRTELSELNESQQKIADELGSLIEGQKLNNALLEKANESSEDLAANVEHMKNIQEYDFYNLVY